MGYRRKDGASYEERPPRPGKFGPDIPLCGAKKRAKNGGGTCTLTAGWGTNHPGFGNCKFHMGSTPSNVKAAAKEEALKALESMPAFGVGIEVDPNAALLACVNRSAGMVAWLEFKLQTIEESAYTISNERGDTKLSVWIELHAAERERLARFCKLALDAGVAERQVRIAEAQGGLIARLMKGVLGDLNLTKEQRELSQQVVRHWLTVEMPALEAAVVE